MDIMVIVLMNLIIVKLRAIQHKPQPAGALMSREKKFKQLCDQIHANRNCAGVLLISLVFVTLPSVFVGITAITGLRIAATVGPFYIFGLLCAGDKFLEKNILV
ncbi:unnamed protein product [Angiostrongylus costaricensis]|uniref:Aa_trans domain-containing protein n=1 Tax=Angiostrongylus costaricensis TaxID=334426 RepID=A0A0R3PGN9_ANGCS|nr:unnamed protein product [Angiostrongylus costaricensis]